MNMYPNPVVNSLTIDTDKEVKSIRIYSSNGALVRKTNLQSGSKIDVSVLKAGIYFVNLETDDGRIIRKFIKE